MPPRFVKPTDVPESRESLVDFLWRFFIAARRPAMRQIADVIQSWDDDKRNGTANHETIRRTLRGEAVGAWLTVEVIFLALCELADVAPDDADDVEDSRWEEPVSHIEMLRRYWNQAVDGGAPMPERLKTRKERAEELAAAQAQQEAVKQRANDDPWGSAPPRGSGGGFSDAPPF